MTSGNDFGLPDPPSSVAADAVPPPGYTSFERFDATRFRKIGPATTIAVVMVLIPLYTRIADVVGLFTTASISITLARTMWGLVVRILSIAAAVWWSNLILRNARQLDQSITLRTAHVAALMAASVLSTLAWPYPVVYVAGRVALTVAAYLIWAALWRVSDGRNDPWPSVWLIAWTAAVGINTMGVAVILLGDSDLGLVLVGLLTSFSSLIQTVAFAGFVLLLGRRQMAVTLER